VPTSWQAAPGATLAQTMLRGVIRASLSSTLARVALLLLVSVTV